MAQKRKLPLPSRERVTSSGNAGAFDIDKFDEFLKRTGKDTWRKTPRATPNTSDQDTLVTVGDIAPVGMTAGSLTGDIGPVADKQGALDGWFKKSESGVAQAILGTGSDLLSDLGTGIVGMGEKVVDSIANIAPYALLPQGNEMGYVDPKLARKNQEIYRTAVKESDEFVKKDLYDEEKVSKQILSGITSGSYLNSIAQNGGQVTKEDIILSREMKNSAQDYLDNQMEKDSVLDTKSDSLVQSAGQLLGTSALQAMGVPWYLTTGVSAYGSEVENALNQGATHEAATLSGIVSAGAEILTEKISGGIKFGGKTLDDAATKFLARNISNKVGRTILKLMGDMAGEGLEEVLSGVMSAVGQKLTYASDKELEELFTKEDAWEAFIGGAALGGFGSATQTVNSAVTGVDAVTELTRNEQKVVDKVYKDKLAEAKKKGKVTEKQRAKIYDQVLRDMENGYISTDIIEEVLGGETYNRVTQAAEWEKSLREEFDTLGKKENPTLADQRRYAELERKLDDVKKTSSLPSMRAQLGREVSELVKGDRLAESYYEGARTKQRFEADLSQYDQKYHGTIQRAMDSGVLNNTNRSHELVDLACKLEADKGITIDFTNNKKIRESGFAVAGKIVNGYKTDTGIGINVQSPKYLNTTVGHEITHVLEGTDAYAALSEVIKSYCIAKEGQAGYDARLKAIEELYKGREGTNPESELVADLVGDYLFTDSDFVSRLSVEDKGLFRKLWDEIKYFCKIVTAGSDEARKLEDVKRVFEDAYRANVKPVRDTESVTQTEAHPEVDVAEVPVEEASVHEEAAYKDEEIAPPVEAETETHEEEWSDDLLWANVPSSQAAESKVETAELSPQDKAKLESLNHKLAIIDKRINSLQRNGNLGEEYQRLLNQRREIVSTMFSVENGSSQLSADDNASYRSSDQNPTDNPDVRFSLSEPVEETKDLIAVHNLHTAELLETLKLSGLPSPSVAIIKAKDGHEKYGDVSLILPKDAIDPQANKSNRIYGSDAWTPTRSNAPVEYEVNYDVQRQFERTVEQLAQNVANGIFSRSSVLGMAGIEGSTGMNLKDVAEKISGYDAVRAAYIAENGGSVEIVYRTKVFDSYGNDALGDYISKVGEQEVARLAAKMMTGERLTAEEIETAKDSMMESWVAKKEDVLKQKPALRETRIAKLREKISDIRVEDFVRNAWEFYEDSGATSDEIDYGATGNNLRAAANRSDVAAWVSEKLQGLLSEPAIYNGKEPFTPSGKRRSFKEMHWEYTAENIVRAMNNADARGANVWNVSGEAIIATATPEYKNISEVRADKGRIFNAEKGDYEQIKDEISKELQQVTTGIIRTTEHQSDNQYDEEQIIGRCIMEAAQGSKTLYGIKRVFSKNGYRIGDAQAKAVLALFDHASKVPTGYFEAKPQRVVGFDEVGVYIIPYDSDVKLKQELLNRGYAIAEYDPKVEGDRTRVINQFENLKFSLFDVGQQPQQHGSWNISGGDVAYTGEDIGPVGENVVREAANEGPGSDPVSSTGYEAESIAPMAEDHRDESQDKMTPARRRVQAKIENTQAELDDLRQRKADSYREYSEEIAEVRAELEGKKNKNTIVATKLANRIARLTRLRDNLDADYAKRITDTENRLEKLHSEEYIRSEQRKEKQESYTEMWKELIGDTSTWKDMPTGFHYKLRTLRRIFRKVVRDATGKQDTEKADAIYDAIETVYDHNEAILKQESQRLKQVFFELDLNHAEDTYAQMLGELRYNPDTTLTEDVVSDFLRKHQGKIDEDKVNKAIEEARKLYDDLFVRVNEVLREQGFREINYRQGYFPHFKNPKQNWFQKLINWKPVNNEIPTSIAGLTAMFKPTRSYQSYDKQRKGDDTDYSLYQGLDTYIHGALDWIYHIEDLQKRRALENYLRYIHSDEGVKAEIEKVQNDETLDAEQVQERIDAIYKEAKNPLGGLVRELMNRTNTLANKKHPMDRSVEEMLNRNAYSALTNVNSRVTANQVVGSISSALTNFIPIVKSWHEVSPVYTLKGLKDLVMSNVVEDDTVRKSDFLTNRLMEEENLYQTGWDKVSEAGAWMMNVFDNISSQTVWRSKYLQNLHEGMSEAEAIRNADQFAKNLMAGRSRGNAPSIFDAKNPIIKVFTAFQLEVANEYGYKYEDLPIDSKSKTRLVKGFITASVGSYIYNALYSSLTGRTAASDPIRMIQQLLAGLFDEEEEPEDVLLDFGVEVAKNIPYVGGMLGGGRIPISSAIPYAGESHPIQSLLADVERITNEDAEDGDWAPLVRQALKPLWYLAMPTAGGQLKKTTEGLGMFIDEDSKVGQFVNEHPILDKFVDVHPTAGSYTDSGQMRFPVEDTVGNRVQAALFGQYANENARTYFDEDIAPLNEKQIQEYMDVDIPIRDYWDYRKGLKKTENTEEKFDYIASLDLPVAKKNILINNAVDRKERVDITGYNQFRNYREFEYQRENPEMYDFLKENGISVGLWDKFDDKARDAYTWMFKNPEMHDFLKKNGVSVVQWSNFDEASREAYKWAYDNPDGYTMVKATTGDVVSFRQYNSELYNIKADKDKNGKSISGSRKEKVIDYLNNLNVDYYTKIILFKNEYNADDTYNMEIIDYLNSRKDISYGEKKTILECLGFKVDSRGNITWD